MKSKSNFKSKPKHLQKKLEDSVDKLVIDFDETGRYCCSLVYSISGQKLKVFDRETNSIKFDIQSPVKENLESVYFLTTDKAYASLQPIALLSSSGNVYIYSLVEETIKLSLIGGHKSPVTCIVSGKNHISTASKDGIISVWHKSDGSLINSFRGEAKSITNLRLVKQSSLLLSTSNNLKVWSTKNFVLEKEIVAHTTTITSLLVSEKHHLCFTAALTDRFIGVHSFDKKQIHHPGFTIDEEVLQLCLFNKHLVAVLSGGKVAIWLDCLKSTNQPRPPTTLIQLQDKTKVSIPVVKVFVDTNQNFLLAATGEPWNLKFESIVLKDKYVDKITIIESKGAITDSDNLDKKPISDLIPRVTVGSALTVNSLMTLGERVTATTFTSTNITNPDTVSDSVPTMKDSVTKLLTQALQANDRDLIKMILSTTVSRQINPTTQDLPPLLAPLLLKILCELTSTSFLKNLSYILWLKALLVNHGTYLQSSPACKQQLNNFLELANLKLNCTSNLNSLKYKLSHLNELQLKAAHGLKLGRTNLVYVESIDEVITVKKEDTNQKDSQQPEYNFKFKRFKGNTTA